MGQVSGPTLTDLAAVLGCPNEAGSGVVGVGAGLSATLAWRNRDSSESKEEHFWGGYGILIIRRQMDSGQMKRHRQTETRQADKQMDGRTDGHTNKIKQAGGERERERERD